MRKEFDFDFEFDKGMIGTTIMMAIMPPIGIFMLLKKLKGFKRGRNDQRKMRNMGISTMLCSLVYLFLDIGGWGALVLLCGLGLTVFSEMSRQKEQRFRHYLAVIGGRSPVALAEIAARCNESVSKVESELQSMIDQGYFGLATYIDHNRHCIVLDGLDDLNWHSPYEAQEKAAAAQTQAREEEDPVATKAADKKAPKTEPRRKEPEQDDQFGRTLSEIRELNDRIADPEISRKIDRIEGITSHIFEIVRRKPEKLGEIRKFMNYYLPTTLKLLDSYALLEEQGIEGDNISASKKQINQILDTLIQSFEKQLDLLFSAQAMDINSDIEVLENMMAADGLKESDFKLKPQTQTRR